MVIIELVSAVTIVSESTDTVGEVAKPDEVGDRLVAAAGRVFAAKGYDGAGVQEIAREAGLTTGAIYSRYAGKAELLRAAIDAECSSELDLLFSHDATDLTQVIGQMGANLVSDTQGSALLFEAFVASRRDPEVHRMVTELMAVRTERLASLVDGAKAEGLVDHAIDTDTVVRFCHTVGLGALVFDAFGSEPPNADRWNDLIARLVSAVVEE